MGYNDRGKSEVNTNMRVYILHELAKLVNESKEYISSSHMWKNTNEVVSVDLNKLADKELADINTYFKTIFGDIEVFKKLRLSYIKDEPANWDMEFSNVKNELNVVFQTISVIGKSRSKPESQTYSRLDHLQIGIKNYIAKNTYKYCLMDRENNLYLVTDVHYRASERDIPASTTVSMSYIYAGESRSKSMSFGSDEIKGMTIGALLEINGYLVINEDDWKQYENYYATFREYAPQIGRQFTSVGKARAENNHYYDSYVSLEKFNAPSKLVIDEDEKKLPSRKHISGNSFWNSSEDLEVPYHTYLLMYDLTSYRNVRCHVKDLCDYIYDKTLINKLILPQETRDILDILLGGVEDIKDDIIRGKSGGIIVISTGLPGVGKTLTAEVYAEIVEKPLYKVQSAQLGIKPTEIEEKLQKCLYNAQKWNAILLIDECDVYLRMRGNDLEHNAIVGVFLRVLEYFGGLLFLTSNRDEMIDDAIYSRKTAHIKYYMPKPDELIKIWNVHLTQQQIKFNDGVINEAVEEFPIISGRDVKNLCKLSRLIMNRKEETEISIDTIRYAAPFVGVNKKDKNDKT